MKKALIILLALIATISVGFWSMRLNVSPGGGMVSISISNNVAKAAGESWLTGWDYRREITISGSVDGELTNYPVELAIGGGLLGSVFPFYIGVGPSSYYYNGKTYITYQGAGQNPYITYYDHSSDTFATPVSIGTNPLTDDYHGGPAVIVDNSGYIHVFYGCHSTDCKYSKSTNPEDISAWSAQSDIEGTFTYPKLVKDSSGVIYLLLRETAGVGYCKLQIRDSGDSFASSQDIIDYSDDVPYVGIPRIDATNGKIYIAWSLWDVSESKYIDICLAYYKISDGKMYSVADDDLGTTVSSAEAGTYCTVVSDNPMSGADIVIDLDENDYPIVFYRYYTGAYYHIAWGGSSWGSANSICSVTNAEGMRAAPYVTASDDIILYIDDTSGGISKYTWNGSSWTDTGEVISSSLFTKGHPRVVVKTGNYNNGLIFVVAETDSDDFSNTDLNMFGFDSNDNWIGLSDNIPPTSNMNTDFSDIRFTASDGDTELYPWDEEGEKTNSVRAVFWVNIPTIPASPSNATIYMYNGNSGASPVSDGVSTFIQFEDFEDFDDGDSVDTDKGTVDWTVVQGTAEADAAQYYGGAKSMLLVGAATQPQVTFPQTSGSGYAIRFRVRKEDAPSWHCIGDNGAYGFHLMGNVDEVIRYYDTAYRDAGANEAVNTWELFEINDLDFSGSHNFDIWFNDSEIKADASMRSLSVLTDVVNFRGYGAAGDVWIDDIIIRKWTANEPTIESVGSEEIGDPDISNSPSSYNYGVVSTSSTYETGLDYFTVTNNSGFAVDITISAIDFTGGVGWTLSDTATAGADTAGLKAGLYGGSYNIIVKKTATYNDLVTSLADSGTQDWGLQLITPTSHSDGAQKTTTVTLSASAS